MKSKTDELPRRERQIMEAVYAAGEATAAEIRAAIPDAPSDSAVRTFLRLLVEKGKLRHKRDGMRYIYQATQPRRKAARSVLRNVVRTFFGGSVEETVVALFSEGGKKLTEEEYERIAALIEKARKEGK
jgi:predicted transcriptional regulator